MQKINFKKFKYKWALAPILLSVSFVAAIYEHNMSEIFLPSLIVPLALAVAIAIFLSLISVLIIKDETRRGLFLSFFVIMAYSYGEVIYLLERFKLESLAKDRQIFPLWMIMIVLGFLFLKKMRKNLSGLARFVLLFSAISIVIPVLSIARFEIAERWLGSRSVGTSVQAGLNEVTMKKEDMPDIYLIVPDSFGSPAILKKMFDIDSSPLVDFLEEKGFYVKEGQTSNYPKTYLSLTSTLNMEYLDYLSVNENSSDLSLVSPLLSYHNLIKYVKSLGYRFYQMGSWWQFTQRNPMADGNITLEGDSRHGISLFNYSIIQSTILKPFMHRLLPKKILGNSDNDRRARNDFQFSELPKTADLPGPKFVFVHILSPHTPYVYGRNCEPAANPEAGSNVEKNYADQVQCVSAKLKDAIEKLLANSKKPPVIIIQSDEGVAYIRHLLPKGESWAKADDEMIRNKFPVFAAYYLPGVPTSTFASSATNVNTLRLVFNAYFNAGFEILPDRNYVFTDMHHSYDFIEVTKKLK